MKIGTEVLIQPDAFEADIDDPVVGELIEPFGGKGSTADDEVAVEIYPEYQWEFANCFIVDKKYCVVR